MTITKSPVHVGEKPQVDFDEQQYRELAAAIGWDGAEAAIRREARQAHLYSFRQFLAENGICVYDPARVQQYMDAEVAKLNGLATPDPAEMIRDTWRRVFTLKVESDMLTPSKRWLWLPLGNESSEFREAEGFTYHITFGHEVRSSYSKPIPLPVLMTAKRIKDQFPEATFEVTDIVDVPKPDPFMAVIYEGERFIIERWNEPSFRQ